MGAMSIISIVGAGVLALIGGLAIGYGYGLAVYWLFGLHQTARAEPGVLSEWPPILGAPMARRQGADEVEDRSQMHRLWHQLASGQALRAVLRYLGGGVQEELSQTAKGQGQGRARGNEPRV
jgi:hypothetical protein